MRRGHGARPTLAVCRCGGQAQRRAPRIGQSCLGGLDKVGGVTRAPTLAELVAAVERRYPPRWAVDGDAIGLVIGDPEDTVERVLFAVDPVQCRRRRGHPSGRAGARRAPPAALPSGVSRVAADEPKGRVIHDLITTRHRAVCRTHQRRHARRSASRSRWLSRSVSTTCGRSWPTAVDPLDKIVTFVPHGDVQRADRRDGRGRSRRDRGLRPMRVPHRRGGDVPARAAAPTRRSVSVGEIEVVAETRIEMVLRRGRARRRDRRTACRASRTRSRPSTCSSWVPGRATAGTGRVGALPAPDVACATFADEVAAALPRNSDRRARLR